MLCDTSFAVSHSEKPLFIMQLKINSQSCKLSTFTHCCINTLWFLTKLLFVKLASTSVSKELKLNLR